MSPQLNSTILPQTTLPLEPLLPESRQFSSTSAYSHTSDSTTTVSRPPSRDAAMRKILTGKPNVSQPNHMLGSISSLGRKYFEARNTFFDSMKKYPEHEYPGAKAFMKAIFEDGLMHVVHGSKPVFLGLDQEHMATLLQSVGGARPLNEKFAIVKYDASKLCLSKGGYVDQAGYLVVNKENLRKTIAQNAEHLGLDSGETAITILLNKICSGESDIFLNETAVGILLGLGEENSRKYITRGEELAALPSDISNDDYNNKLVEINERLGTMEIGSQVSNIIRDLDITVPRPWLGSVWDSDETEKLASASVLESLNMAKGLQEFHAARRTSDPDANYADSAIEYIATSIHA